MSLYRKSNGDFIEIESMAFSYLKNAAAKIEREGHDPQGVLAEMKERLAVLDAQWRAEHPEESGE